MMPLVIVSVPNLYKRMDSPKERENAAPQVGLAGMGERKRRGPRVNNAQMYIDHIIF